MAKILIVEDNFDNLSLIRLLLEMEGHQVVIALNGEEGLDLVHSEKPDLIALDLHMPVLDGWEFLDHVKGDHEINDIPIVVVTAHLLPKEHDRVMEAGGAGFVSKPFKIKELVKEIQNCLPAKP